MAPYLTASVAAFALAYFSIYGMHRQSVRIGFVDLPSLRKRHRQPISLVGGLGIFLAFFATIFFMLGLNPFFITIFHGSLALLLMGLIDDWHKSKGKELPPLPKLAVQLAVGFFAYSAGFQMEGIRGAGIWTYYAFPEWMSAVATVAWVVALVNMMNFLDGLDGLAGGIAAISGSTLFLMALFRGQEEIALLASAFVGACLGFLRFNFHPAKVYMGDSGSQVLGFLLAMIALVGTLKSATIATLGITVLALGVPILDTLQVFISRVLRGHPLYRADRSHVHHLLLKGGLSDVQAVGVLYLAGILLSLISLFLFLRWAAE